MLVIVHQTNGRITRMETKSQEQADDFIKREKKKDFVSKIYLGAKLVYTKKD